MVCDYEKIMFGNPREMSDEELDKAIVYLETERNKLKEKLGFSGSLNKDFSFPTLRRAAA